jgi:hypothetical protein
MRRAASLLLRSVGVALLLLPVSQQYNGWPAAAVVEGKQSTAAGLQSSATPMGSRCRRLPAGFGGGRSPAGPVAPRFGRRASVARRGAYPLRARKSRAARASRCDASLRRKSVRSKGPVPDQIRLTDAEVKRALNPDEYYLVLIGNVKAGQTDPKVRIVNDPVGQLKVEPSSSLLFRVSPRRRHPDLRPSPPARPTSPSAETRLAKSTPVPEHGSARTHAFTHGFQ